jgi:hypothetical protein
MRFVILAAMTIPRIAAHRRAAIIIMRHAERPAIIQQSNGGVFQETGANRA